MLRDTPGLEPSSTMKSSEGENNEAAGDVRGLSLREPWKKSDGYQLVSYRDKEGMS